ncbi:FGGY family carbohydrate kinase, partial [Staphylococcus epidermidis]|uniref:FGGY family carbohydrate kinase n=1 Tax=Staphylococcus epidermidis TaxID=1282 RepID=UPI0037DA10D9
MPKQHINFISFTPQMHTFIPINHHNQPLTQNITSPHNPPNHYPHLIQKSYPPFQFYQPTPTPIHPISPLSKIFSITHHQPKIFKQTPIFPHLKTYLLFQ